ncbi:hypothetical protein FRC01_004382 [Tulasnella sp. 417]|nr:hypothetical protein FRC01_004382 [Tulasnella sp. 417]
MLTKRRCWPSSDAGTSETGVNEVPAPNVLVDYESSGSHNTPTEDAAFEHFSKKQDSEHVVHPLEPSSEMDAAAILDQGFVLNTEENEASSSKGAPSSDEAPSSNDDATSPAQANGPPASPASPAAPSVVLVTATPALGSDDIEIPDTQADATDTDTGG